MGLYLCWKEMRGSRGIQVDYAVWLVVSFPITARFEAGLGQAHCRKPQSLLSTVENGASIKLVIEVVSTNWQDDYEVKLVAYEAMGIPEYWILDYAGLGGVRHLGRPKQPMLTVCTLVEGEYEVARFRADDRILSPLFSGLELSAGSLMKVS